MKFDVILWTCFCFLVPTLTGAAEDLVMSRSDEHHQHDDGLWQQNDDTHTKFDTQNDNHGSSTSSGPVGLSPPVLNLAMHAAVSVNATCGEHRSETYCKLVEHVHLRSRPESQCDVCDARSHDRNKRHPIEYAVDGSGRWWQSPSMQTGKEFEWVTITIDLRQVYQVAYIVIKAANSPRPGNWILERSLDGQEWMVWQYYAISNEECWSRYGLEGQSDKPQFEADDQVICTSYYSKITPFEGGEIHTSLVNGRPGAAGPSETLIKFTMAQFIRLRFQKIRTLLADLVHGGGEAWDRTVMRRYFYSIKDISIGGHCVCFGHSNECVTDPEERTEKCMCKHNTCGTRCDHCCPLFNQYRWVAGNSTNAGSCEACECHGHADSCVFDEAVAASRKSINVHGMYDGGGVCVGCTGYTTGINCERCIDGYFRPNHVDIRDTYPCRKCDCDSTGAVGSCFSDQDPVTPATANLKYGDCICKPGFGGKRCDRCTDGWRGFPNCVPCPCNMAGVIDGGCDGQCVCKSSVEGDRCNSCRPGFYNLDALNPNGCTQCFCNGLTDQCTGSNASVIRLDAEDEWFVSDMAGTRVVPVTRSGGMWHISNEEFTGINAGGGGGVYFWCSNGTWTGYHLDSYGLSLVFHVSWVQARGDTSGRHIREWDVLIRGRNSMLALGDRDAPPLEGGDNATISVRLNEIQCHVLSLPETTESDARPRPCTRYDVMHVLYDVRLIMLRAKYRTDQLEGMLLDAWIEKADSAHSETEDGPTGVQLASSVEVCNCPPGYMGPSCETCAYGYRAAPSRPLDTWLTRCYPCECNGHARSCDLDGTCWQCEHNTTGSRCERCEVGFYGRPASGAPCKPCECPLATGTGNSFSTSCELEGNNYRCTACEEGYEGDYCEKCANGWWGNPTRPGDSCKPCQCAGASTGARGGGIKGTQPICDHLTGECFVCSDGAAGWKCEECLPGYYGNPLNGTCQPCSCNKYGSVGLDCHPETGLCICADNFEGAKCDRCVAGHGSPEEDCPPCGCDPRGSESGICDPNTGACTCKPGVGGRYCNRCLDLHYNFSANGCTPCDCDTHGCDSQICNIASGQCSCLPHVQGRQCSECEPGHWGIQSGLGCPRTCGCHTDGATGGTCDQSTGQCPCRPGVGGRTCDQCAVGYWGTPTGDAGAGCRPCDPCTKPGHVCDRTTGHCACLPNTEGDTCDKCVVGAWGYDSHVGCELCNCSGPGAISQQCSLIKGTCACREGFDGPHCDTCAFGYFGYPKCSPCSCDPAGTIESYCDDEGGVCGCDAEGACACKDNVIGPKCSRCASGTYDLRKSNPEGCQECFCFRRSNKCSQGLFQWERLGSLNSRSLTTIRTTNHSHSHSQAQAPRVFNPYNEGEEQCFIYLALPSERRVEPLWNSKFRLKLVNNLIVIPDSGNDVMLENEISFGAPLYWPLPHIFTGDKVLSYGGYLRFRVTSEGGGTVFPRSVLESYPLVQIQGNYRLILEHFVQKESANGYYEIKLHEDYWQLKNFNSAPAPGSRNREGAVTKEVMMVALQNLQSILIRGTSSPEIHSARLFNVSLDIAVPATSKTSTPAFGIEICDCPPEYNSTSCQNPKLGYYRWYKNEYITSTVIIDLIGQAKPCECNGRAEACDTETGACVGCVGNTGGAHCDECAVGFYGNAGTSVGCAPCPCPSVWTNHAATCKPLPGPSRAFQCRCRAGYTGPTCEKCEFGFYGNATAPGAGCQPCVCNEYGSVGKECDPTTGQCACRPGITGRDCGRCSARHVLIGRVCTSCADQCTGTLLATVDEAGAELRAGVHALLDGYEGDSSHLVANVSERAVWTRVTWLEGQADLMANALSVIGSDESAAPLRTRIENFIALHRALSPVLALNCNQSESYTAQAIDALMRISAAREAIDGVTSSARQSIDLLEKYARGAIRPPTSNVTVEREMRALLEAMQSAPDLAPLLIQVRAEHAEATAALTGVQDLVWTFDDFREDINKARDRLDDARHWMTTGARAQAQADGVLYTAHEHLRGLQSSIEAINNAVATGLVDTGAATDETLTRAEHALEETRQVLAMVEDLLVDARNWSKDVDIRGTALRELVPLHRVRWAQPAFDHVRHLQAKATGLQGLARQATEGGAERLERLETLRSVSRLVDEATELVAGIERTSDDTRGYMDRYLVEDELKAVADDSEGRRRDGETLREIVERAMQNNIDVSRAAVENAERNLESVRKSLSGLDSEIERLDSKGLTDERYAELIAPLDAGRRLLDEIAMQAMQIESELKSRISGTPLDSLVNLENVRTVEEELRLRLGDITAKLERMRTQYESSRTRQEGGTLNMEYLKALIAQARHRANAVPVSLGPDESGICFRLFAVRGLALTTSVSFKFAPIRSSDSLLFFWPSSINEDFISIEMVNLRIKVSWNLGSGLHTIVYPRRLVPDLESDSQSPGASAWVAISVERVGSSVSVQVTPSSGGTEAAPVAYQGADEESTLLDLAPTDLVHIGGFSRSRRPGLVANGLSGCIHDLQINGAAIGLWNFVGNEGCAPCIECPRPEDGRAAAALDYYARGAGAYAAVPRVQSQTFNPSVIEIAIEFRTYASDGLLFLTVNDVVGQSVCLELRGGQLLFSVQHAWTGSPGANPIAVQTNGTVLNNGAWIQAHAIWVFQAGAQIVQLTVDGARYTETLSAPSPLTLQLSDAVYNIGGLAPTFKSKAAATLFASLQTKASYRGCLRNVLIDGTTYDLVAGQHHGIESGCARGRGHDAYAMTFAGTGFAEYVAPSDAQFSQLFGNEGGNGGKELHFGFSFRTTYPSGILAMVTVAQSQSPTQESAEISIQPWLLIYLENGQIFVQVGTLAEAVVLGNGNSNHSNGAEPNGSHSNEVDVELDARRRYDDGHVHAFRISRRNRRLRVYMDDELVQEDRLPKKAATAATPPASAGSGTRPNGRVRLFFGGINLEREQYLLVEAQIPKNRFRGCIEYFFYGPHLLPFNDPVAAEGQTLGPCDDTGDVAGAVHSYGRLTLTNGGRRRPAVGGDLLRSLDDDDHPRDGGCSPFDSEGVQFGASPQAAQEDGEGEGEEEDDVEVEESYGSITLQSNTLKQKFNLTFSFRTQALDAMLLYGLSKPGKASAASCLLISLRNSTLSLKLHGNRPQELLCSNAKGSSLNDDAWHQISVIKSENKLYIFMDGAFQTNCEYQTTKIKSIHKLYIGGAPEDSSLCLGSSSEDPPPLRGCMKGLIINSYQYSFGGGEVSLHGPVSPCATGKGDESASDRNLVLDSAASPYSSKSSSTC